MVNYKYPEMKNYFILLVLLLLLLNSSYSQKLTNLSLKEPHKHSLINISFPVSFCVPVPFINSSIGTSIGFNKFIELSVVYNFYSNTNYNVKVLDVRVYYTSNSNDNKFKGYFGIGAGYILTERYIKSKAKIFPFLSCKGEYALGKVVSIGGEVKILKNNMFNSSDYELLPMATVTFKLPETKF
ncbi:MAG: hypothetical protein EHM58_11290 [Ignavibacteriae bacterium]|nr:MAG: hypothetical protein EHM58_11290 [Ignavibacteriota bacterium]